MQALKDAAVLLTLGVLLISVRITPLQEVDWIPPAEAGEAGEIVQDVAAETPRAGRPADLQPEDDDRAICVLHPDGLTRVDGGTRSRQRAAERVANANCT